MNGNPCGATEHDRAPWGGADRLYLGVIAGLLTLPLGYIISRNPGWLQIGFDPTQVTHLFGLLAAVALSIVILRWPEAGILGLVAVIYTNASDIGIRVHHLPSVLQVFLPLLAIALLGRHLFSRPVQPVVWDTVFIWVLLYGVVIFCSSAKADNPQLADAKLIEHLKNMFILLLIVNLLNREQTLWNAVWVLVIIGAVLGTINAYQVFTTSYESDFGGFGRIKLAQIVGNVREPRISGPLSDPNFYAQILVVLVPLALYRLWDESSLRGKVIAGYALVATLLALIFTYSRGGALALGLTLLLVAINKKVMVRPLLVGLLVLVPLVLMVPQQFKGRLGTLGQLLPGNDESTVHLDSALQERMLLMRSAWEMFSDHPWLGVGAGNYTERYDEYAERIGSTVSSYEGFDKPRFSHSLYLEVMAETGLVGLAVFAGIMVSTLLAFRAAYRDFMDAGNTRAAGLVVSLALGFIAYLTTSLFLHGDYLRHFWLLVAIAIVAKHVARRHQEPRVNRAPALQANS